MKDLITPECLLFYTNNIEDRIKLTRLYIQIKQLDMVQIVMNSEGCVSHKDT